VEVTLGDIMAHVVVKIGKSQIESVITRRSAKELNLKKGDKVKVVIKSTEVMLDKD
jgi:molybdopterin-binding protein